MWNEGYISEIDYLYGYFSELCPIRLKLALLSRGISHSVGASPTYLELGFGQGLSLNVNAATTSGRYIGTDFNPGQAAHARMLAQVSGKPVEIYDQSFEELAARNDLPEFDIIALHGIWSWISESSRAAILKIAREKLKAGGIFYISYNVTPGWSPAVPLRHLLNEYSRRAATGGILARVDQSINFVEHVIDAQAAYFTANPALKERLEAIKAQDRSYVSHEYFNHHWRPESFSDVHDILSEAKLSFGASANIIDNIEGISVPANAVPVLNGLSDPVLRETTRDYFVNQQFRRDIFVKGPRRMTAGEVNSIIAEQKFVVLGRKEDAPKVIHLPIGEAELKPEIYQPIVDALDDGRMHALTAQEVLASPHCANLSLWQVWEAMLLLVGSGFIAPASDSETLLDDIAASQQLNAEICRRARFSGSMQYLAAPVIGSAINLGRIEQLFLLAREAGEKDPVLFVWDALHQQGERLIVDGRALETVDENLSRLKELQKDFENRAVPMLQVVGVLNDNAI